MVSGKAVFAFSVGTLIIGLAAGYFVFTSQNIDLRTQLSDALALVGSIRDELADIQSNKKVLESKLQYYKSPLLLEYTKSGGIAGIQESIAIDSDGNLALNKGEQKQVYTLSQQDLSDLKGIIIENGFFELEQTAYEPKRGTADFFSYELEVALGNSTNAVNWVDDWATEQKIPDELHNIQQAVENLVETKLTQSNESTVMSNGLTLTLVTDKPEYKTGELVKVKAILANKSSEPVHYTSPTPCELAIRIIVDANIGEQDITYTTVSAVPCIQVLEERTIDAKEIVEQNAIWDQTVMTNGKQIKVPAGVYTIQARFPLANWQDAIISNAIDVRIL